MSAFVVNTGHIKALLRAGLARRQGGYELRWLAPEIPEPTDYQRGEPWGPTSTANARRRWRELTDETVNEVGRMLLMENVRSVAHRYDEPTNSNNLPGPIGLDMNEVAFSYAEVMRRESLSPVAILKAIDCYEYQSCEHPAWEESESQAFCEALRHRTIDSLPGYDEADWEVTAELGQAS